MIGVAAFEAPAAVAGRDNVAVVSQTIEQRGPALPSVPGLDLQTVNEVDYVIEASADTGLDAASGNGKMRPVPVPPDVSSSI